MGDHFCKEGVERLCIAIIRMAARDYLDALRVLKYNSGNNEAMEVKRECERFFRSRWYEELTDLNGEFLIRKLCKEADGN